MLELNTQAAITTEKMAFTSTNHGLRQLNVGIALMLSASATAGYNASQINSLLVLPECESSP